MDSPPQLSAGFQDKLNRLIATEIERARGAEQAGLRAQIAVLEKENRKLRDEIATLKQASGNGADTTTASGNNGSSNTGETTTTGAGAPPRVSPVRIKRERADSWDRSPIKMKSFGGTATLGEIPALRSQSLVEEEEVPFHRLPTQYSDDESVVRSSPIKLSPAKAARPSQESSRDPADNSERQAPPAGPPGTTTLQRREFLHQYYRGQYAASEFQVSLATNPITEQPWIISDFRPNPSFVKRTSVTDGGITRKIGLTRQDEDNRRRFYRAANGATANNNDHPGTASDDGAASTHSDSDSYDAHASQLFDKFPSPPGFMVSEFPSTQEGLRRRQVVERRQRRRIHRRVQACVEVSHGRQVGEFVFRHDVLNWYVVAGRWYL